jgi:alpha-amylase
LRPFSVFELNRDLSYFVEQKKDLAKDDNATIFHKVAQKSYLPMLQLLLELTLMHPNFSFALSCSGVFLEQAQAYEPNVISLIQKLVKTGHVELLAETYYHSLASLYSPTEFAQQVQLHSQLVKKLFNVTPTVFRNTELIYANAIAEQVQQMGYYGMLTEAVDRYLGGRPRTQLYKSYTNAPLPLMLKHAQLSDDVAFRFSNREWEEHPLTSEKYVHWLNNYGKDEYINLFMDFETFGEHQWEDTGIFTFFRHFVDRSLQFDHHFVTPTQVLKPFAADPKALSALPAYDVPEPISWADIDRDLTAWRGNSLQHDALRLVYSLEKDVIKTNNAALIDDWRRLQTSDHFYYMCVKWSADGDVHKYFSPYDSPFEAYNRFSAVMVDVQDRLRALSAQTGRPRKGV